MRIWNRLKWIVGLPAFLLGLVGFGLMMLGVGVFSVAKYMFLLIED